MRALEYDVVSCDVIVWIPLLFPKTLVIPKMRLFILGQHSNIILVYFVTVKAVVKLKVKLKLKA